MAKYTLTQTAQEVQNDLNKVEALAEIKSIGSGLNLSSAGELSASGGGGGSTTNSIDLSDVAKGIVAQFQYQNIGIKRSSDTEVDVIIIAGQSNSCGRASLSDSSNHRGYLIDVPVTISWTYQDTASGSTATHKEIVEPISANGSSGYGYVPAFVRSYYEATGRKTCLCFSSSGGTSLNRWLHYKYTNGEKDYTAPGSSLYTNMINAVNFAKSQIVTDGYTLGHVILLWLQGENEATYYGTDSTYNTPPEKLLDTFDKQKDFYKDLFNEWITHLKSEIGLQKACIIRIGQRNTNDYFYGSILEAQSELGQEYEDICVVSTCLAGERIWKYPGSTETVNLMRDSYHYSIEGYIYAGIEAGLNMGIYVNSQFKTKPVLYEYNTEYKKHINVYSASQIDYALDDYLYLPMPHNLTGFQKYAKRNTTSIALSPSSFAGVSGSTVQLEVSYTPSNATDKGVTYTSSNDSIATVSSGGLVTLSGTGTATITATLIANNTISSTSTITCTSEILPTSVTLNESSAQVLVGSTYQLTATVLPANATNKNVVWTSSNNSAATVDANGLVTFYDLGTVTITCTSAVQSSVTASCAFTINAQTVPLLDLDFTQHTVDYYIAQNILELPASTTDDGATYDQDGLHFEDESFEAGINLVTPILNSGNLEIILVAKIAPFTSSGSSNAFVKYGNLTILASNAGTPANNLLAPCVLFTTASDSANTNIQVRHTSSNSTSGGPSINFPRDGQFHEIRIVLKSNQDSTSKVEVSIDNGTVTTRDNIAVTRGGSFTSIFGITREYSSSVNFYWNKGQVVKSLQVNRL